MRRYENSSFRLAFERKDEWVKFTSNGGGRIVVDSEGVPTLTRNNTEQLIAWLQQRLDESKEP
jgi:hypothetical protein